MTKRTLIAVLTLAALLVVLAVFFVFDPAQGGFFPACLFHKLTGLNCPGCGGLRALHHLTHGQIAVAFHCNPLLMVLLPLVAFIGLRWLLRGSAAFGKDPILLLRPAMAWMLLAVTLVFTVLRNLPGPAFAWMSPWSLSQWQKPASSSRRTKPATPRLSINWPLPDWAV